jgi:hypothetical protein
MRKLVFSFLAFLAAPQAYCSDAPEQIAQSVFHERVSHQKSSEELFGIFDYYDFGYVVDSITQICYAYRDVVNRGANNSGAGSGLQAISCKLLKKRPIWQKIITWE